MHRLQWYENVSPRGKQQLDEAISVLARHEPWHHHHLVREIEVVSYFGGGGCPPGSLACTAAYHGRRVVLVHPPEYMDSLELAVLLSHEARHHYTDAEGWHREIPHTCVDCTSPWQRASDPIYQEDERLRRRLRSALAAAAQGVTAGQALLGVGLALLLAKALSRV